MTPRDFMHTLVGGYRVVLITVAAALVLGLAYLATQPQSYRVSSLVHVEYDLPSSADAKTIDAAIAYAKYRTITFEVLVDSDDVLKAVIDRLDLDVSASELSDRVIAISALDTNIIEIYVSWPDAQGAADIANALAEQVSTDFSSSTDEIGIEVVPVRAAYAERAVLSPSPGVILGLATLGGVLVSAVWLSVRKYVRAMRERA